MRLCNSFEIDSAEVGKVKVVVSRSAKNVTLRRNATHIRITVPYGLEKDRFFEILEDMMKRLPAENSAVRGYSEGIVVDNDLLHIVLERRPGQKRAVELFSGRRGWMVIGVRPDVDLNTPAITKGITSLLVHIAKLSISLTVIPLAVRIATETHCFPAGWKVGTGLKTLGTCSSRRVITLSAAIAFLPEHLRRYVICHELAHLREMNHSPRFHSLCNEYCHGQAARLEAELKSYKWPIIR